MSVIAPTITAPDLHEFRKQANRVLPFAKRLHIDLMDGRFAPSTSLPISDVDLPGHITCDIHVMYERPQKLTEALLKLKPNLVILHAEADGDFGQLADLFHRAGIKVGLALLPRTPVEEIEEAIALVDHVLIFSGNLGYQGGSRADPNLLYKIDLLRRLKPELEIGWDGGINDKNAHALEQAGIDVLNVGGFIQLARDPARAYHKLEAIVA
jgi:ribulose-phosphate 3-epimerase